ncbi:hypothetical protein KFL_009290030 [Klebsormidium nitens]|uniref:Uncharacterized protein n=1 Tax=Klebsormidium nitens TaxID=105231 RepID=A0A1Y1IS89_KLENI|nr:hypothetical protein KFL_009290030 [Klebsormidium nitens]|eukprot:GAQ92131.1 hypothetical protein KFL_009290030 [Klebsormidium nitens]
MPRSSSVPMADDNMADAQEVSVVQDFKVTDSQGKRLPASAIFTKKVSNNKSVEIILVGMFEAYNKYAKDKGLEQLYWSDFGAKRGQNLKRSLMMSKLDVFFDWYAEDSELRKFTWDRLIDHLRTHRTVECNLGTRARLNAIFSHMANDPDALPQLDDSSSSAPANMAVNASNSMVDLNVSETGIPMADLEALEPISRVEISTQTYPENRTLLGSFSAHAPTVNYNMSEVDVPVPLATLAFPEPTRIDQDEWNWDSFSAHAPTVNYNVSEMDVPGPLATLAFPEPTRIDQDEWNWDSFSAHPPDPLADDPLLDCDERASVVEDSPVVKEGLFDFQSLSGF